MEIIGYITGGILFFVIIIIAAWYVIDIILHGSDPKRYHVKTYGKYNNGYNYFKNHKKQ